ncbi:MAG: hypothetical protein ACK4R6_01970 [Spirosomataceae bacterium]|mgnify:FL=1|jgi:hypothetical protein
MRLIKEIPNDFCKTTVFSFNNKFIIKLEAGNYEQTFKVSEYDVSSIDEIEEMLGDTFYKNAMERFRQMNEDLESVIDMVD